MAEFYITSVKDECTGEFLSPVFVHNKEEAKRFFSYQLNNTELWKQNAEQFTLWDLGLFDSTTGNIIGNDEPGTVTDIPVIHPDLICKGTDIIPKKGE